MNALRNVIPLIEKKDTVETILDSFVGEYEINSIATAKAYRRDVLTFIENYTPMGLDTPSSDMTHYINYTNVTDYRRRDSNLAATTVNRKVVAIKEFAKHLRIHQIPVDIAFFDDIKSMKGRGESYEVLSVTEALMIAEWLRDNEKFKAEAKYYYSTLAFDTGIRAEALSKLTSKNFTELEDSVVIKGVDKGKKNFSKHISKNLYNEMRESLEAWNTDEKPLFNFSEKNRFDMMNRALKGLGWEDRNITFHSFKKAAVNGAFETTGDIRIAMKVGSHNDMTTTQRYLAEAGDDYLGAVSNGNLKEIKEAKYDEFSKEELVKALEQMSQNHQHQMKTALVNNRKQQ